MPTPTCATDCGTALPPVNFSNCSPQVSYSEIERAFFAKPIAAAFADWTSPTEWTARINPSTTVGDDYIRELHVIGDKPAATPVTIQISRGRNITIGKDHTVNLTIDDISDETYEFFRALECGSQVKFWYETAGAKAYGGNEGIIADVVANSVLNRGRDQIENINLTLTWRAKFSPERTDSPIAGSNDEGGAPDTYDTLLSFASDNTPGPTANVSATASATDAEQQFEFNAISGASGTPQSMTISVGGVDECVVNFLDDYTGEYFKYTDKAGVVHIGQFINGDRDFS